MKFIVAKIQGSINRLEGLKIDLCGMFVSLCEKPCELYSRLAYIDLSFFSLRSDDFTTVDNQTIWRDFVVEL